MDEFIRDLRDVMNHTRKLKVENRLKKITLGIARRLANAVGGETIGRFAGKFNSGEKNIRRTQSKKQAAFYGLTGNLPDRDKVSDALLELLDGMYS
jgi:beta-galactosidase GanA